MRTPNSRKGGRVPGQGERAADLSASSFPTWKAETGSSIWAHLGLNNSLVNYLLALEKELKDDPRGSTLDALKVQSNIESPTDTLTALEAMKELGHISLEIQNHFHRLGQWLAAAVICKKDPVLAQKISSVSCSETELLEQVPPMLFDDKAIQEFISDCKYGRSQESERAVLAGLIDVICHFGWASIGLSDRKRERNISNAKERLFQGL